MKKIVLFLLGFVSANIAAQFTVNVSASENFTPKEVYAYTINGSKDILVTKEVKKGNAWNVKVPQAYTGMLKLYFPENNFATNFISENKDVKINIVSANGKVTNVVYLDETNRVMDEAQSNQRKREDILPALYQIREYYKPDAEFGKAIDKEIAGLSSDYKFNADQHPFVNYYVTNYNKFLVNNPTSVVTADDIVNFFSKSNPMLETSTLMRPILADYLQKYSRGNVEAQITQLLDAVNLETPRGQTVLSELIDIFDSMGMSSLKDQYLTKAKNLKCTINDRLASTIEMNKNTELGAKFPNTIFTSAKNTSAKSIYDVKADKKVVVFWSSTCSHCEAELPQFIPLYNQMKAKNIEVIGLSLDADKNSYENRVKNFPWVNDAELKGWYSNVADLYNIKATPTYFILDANNKIIDKPDHIADVFKYLGLK